MNSARYTSVFVTTLFLLKIEKSSKLVKFSLSLKTICFVVMIILSEKVDESYDLFQKLKNIKSLTFTSDDNCFYFNILEQVIDDSSLAMQLNIISDCIQASFEHIFLQIEKTYESFLEFEQSDYSIQERHVFDSAALFEDTET